ncbi:hypothetical protein [Pseudoduganella sp. OTU4001]|uniref:hypothetical protein n=1 Tax=Pseudoduganella sp. OTU4001 TaxID=3043854 RepID=UPI00313E66A8
MGSEQEKSKIELAVFNEFIAKTGVPVVPATIRKPGTPSEPDIFCTLSNGEQVAYELVEICSSDIAATISKIRKGGDSVAGSTSDPTERTLRQKLHKKYRTNLPIELLCYTNGRTVSPDDQILCEAQVWANAISGPFRKVWLLGETGVYEVWSAC